MVLAYFGLIYCVELNFLPDDASILALIFLDGYTFDTFLFFLTDFTGLLPKLFFIVYGYLYLINLPTLLPGF